MVLLVLRLYTFIIDHPEKNNFYEVFIKWHII